MVPTETPPPPESSSDSSSESKPFWPTFWFRLNNVARCTAFIALFALLMNIMELYGPQAKSFFAGLCIGLVIGPMATILFLTRPTDDEEEEEES